MKSPLWEKSFCYTFLVVVALAPLSCWNPEGQRDCRINLALPY